MGCGEVEDLNIQVLQSFGVKARRIVKEKSYYICSTDKGMRVINKSMETAAHIIFEYEIKEHLNRAGFPNTDRFYLSLAGKPYVEHDDNLYVMTNHFNYRESDFSNNKDFQKIVAGVAKMHSALAGVKFEGQLFFGMQSLSELIKKSLSDFSGVKRKIGAQKRLSDFDVLFIKNFDYYVGQMKTSMHMLEKVDICAFDENIKLKMPICHNLLKEEHLLHDADRLYVTTFSQACIDSWVVDICGLIQRYAKALPLRPYRIGQILELYDKYNSLGQADLDILYALLKFPYKYVKICNQYYSKKRTWTPSAIINRVESIISTKNDYDDFIEDRI